MIDMYFFTFMFVFNIMIAGALIILEYVLGITNNIDKNGINKGHIAVVVFLSTLVLLATR